MDIAHAHAHAHAHAQAPQSLRALFKEWQKCSIQDALVSDNILDLNQGGSAQATVPIDLFSQREGEINAAVREFLSSSSRSTNFLPELDSSAYKAFTVTALPGLTIFPSLLSEYVQLALLDKLLHRDLTNPKHKTNVHLFHHLSYPAAIPSETDISETFFSVDQHYELQPRDPQIHKPMTIGRMLQRKLRWMTLGGQYDWTAKVYPDEEHPQFPQDIALLLKAFFPDVDAEAAIINFYSPGDTLSVHRDVSEDCNRGLISLSIGCDAIFLIGNDEDGSQITLRLRSGDALLMSDEARFAWHAVPKILPNTCPAWLQSWPTSDKDAAFKVWENWMATKRININVRQMQERSNKGG